MPTTLITGASRGIGLGLVKAYAADSWRVLACARTPANATDLQKAAEASRGLVSVHALDVEDHAAIARVAADLKGQPIDVLLNVAGLYGARGSGRFGDSDFPEWERIFRTNIIGPMKMAEAFVEHVAASTQRKIVSLSSILGSMTNNAGGGIYGYRASKAGLNAVMRSMAIDLKSRGIIAVSLHPGWVRTDMGGAEADIDVNESVTGVMRVIARLTLADGGKLWAYSGTQLGW